MPLARLSFLILLMLSACPQPCCGQASASERPAADSAQQAFARARQIYEEKGAREALPGFQKALALSQAEGDRRTEIAVLRALGNCYKHLADKAAALDHFKRALVLSREIADRLEEGKTLNSLGLYYWDASELRAAIASFTPAGDIARELGNRQLEAAVLNNLGLVYDELGDYRRSLETYNRALDLQRALLKANADPAVESSQSDTLGNLGGVSLILGRFREAADYYQQALVISERLKIKRSISQDLINIGLCQTGMGQLNESLATFDRAIALAREAGYQKEEADAEKGKGSALLRLGLYDAAREQFRLVRQVYERAGMKLQLVDALNDGGTLAAWLGDSASAERDFRHGLRLSVAIKHPQGVTSNLLALSDLEWRRGRLPQAAALCRQALDGARKVSDTGSMADAYLQLSRIDRSLKRVDEAFDDAQYALKAARATGARPAEAQALLATAEAEQTRGRPQEALALLAAAAAMAGEIGDPEVNWRIAFERGRALEASGRETEAVSAYQDAVAVIESVRERIREDRYRAGYMQDRYQVYSMLVRLLRKLGRDEEAFSFAERLRARSYLELLNRGVPPLPDERQRRIEMELRQRIRHLQRAIEEKNTVPETRGETLDVFRAELRAAERAYQELIDDLRRDQPAYADALALRVPSSGEVRAKLPPASALVEYVLGQDSVVIFIVTGSGLRAVNVAVRPADLQGKVELLRDLILRREAGWDKPAESLRTLLIEPAEESGALQGVQRLFLVPHGVLHYLPFAVLARNTGAGKRFLAEDYELAYLPAAAALSSANSTAVRHVLAMAPARSRLPFARQEARAIARFFPDKPLVLVGLQATKGAFERSAGNYQILHLATHGYFNKFNPLFSGVQLEPDQRDDGRLDVHEILGLRLNASLVTLSACDTAMSSGYFAELPAGDELVSLTRAFLYAGGRSVLASLWEVDDRSTMQLMRGFYRRLAGGSEKSSALAAAQRAVIHGPALYRHPYYWAPFILVGQAN